jgi:hypothetical protein
MATPAELAVRVLRKLRVIGASETASAEDLDLAIEGLGEAHSAVEVAGLSDWTLDTIPENCEVGYVMMAAYLRADEFLQPKDPAMMVMGMRQIQGYVYVPNSGVTSAEDF